MERYREKQGDLFRGNNTRDLLDSLKLDVSPAVKNFSPKHLRSEQNCSHICNVNLRIGYPGKFPARGKPLSTLPIKTKASQEAFLLSQISLHEHLV